MISLKRVESIQIYLYFGAPNLETICILRQSLVSRQHDGIVDLPLSLALPTGTSIATIIISPPFSCCHYHLHLCCCVTTVTHTHYCCCSDPHINYFYHHHFHHLCRINHHYYYYHCHRGYFSNYHYSTSFTVMSS